MQQSMDRMTEPEKAAYRESIRRHAARKMAEFNELQASRSSFYETYIRSPQWRQLSQRLIKEAGRRCRVCNSGIDLCVHHRTYENLGHEPDQDLIVLCHDCHEIFHATRISREDFLR